MSITITYDAHLLKQCKIGVVKYKYYVIMCVFVQYITACSIVFFIVP